LIDEELLDPSRTNGTLRAYRRHQLSADLLADPGEQDLTAHVNLSAIQLTGENAGLRTEACITQAQFLTSIATRACRGTEIFEAWTSAHRRQFQTLTHPEHLGRAFRVLIQSRY
jgi:SAM-dependent MidA family methyltransferase